MTRALFLVLALATRASAQTSWGQGINTSAGGGGVSAGSGVNGGAIVGGPITSTDSLKVQTWALILGTGTTLSGSLQVGATVNVLAGLGATSVTCGSCTVTGALGVTGNSAFTGAITAGPTLTAGTTALVVTAGGVGIGTASPANKLHVSSGSVMIDGTIPRLAIGGFIAEPYNDIGGSVDQTLSVNGAMTITSTATAGNPYLLAVKSGGETRFGITATGRLYMDAVGEVAASWIGTNGNISFYTGGGGNAVIANGNGTNITFETAGNIGVTDLTPDAHLEILARAADNYHVQVSSQDDVTKISAVDKFGHFSSSAAVNASLGTCTNGTLVMPSNDGDGAVTFSGANTACAINFANTYPSAGVLTCMIQGNSDTSRLSYATHTMAVLNILNTVGQAASDRVEYRCQFVGM